MSPTAKRSAKRTAARSNGTRTSRRPARSTRVAAAESSARASAASRVIREQTPGAQLPAGATRTPGAPPASSDKRGKYVYCIIHADEPLRFGPIGIGSPSRRGPHRPLRGHRRRRLRHAHRGARRHPRERAGPRARQRGGDEVSTPSSPCRSARCSRPATTSWSCCGARTSAFQDVLAKMENKVEFGLKVLWDREVMIRADRARGRGHPPPEDGDRRPEGLDLLRPHAVRPPGGRRAAEPLRAVRRRDLRGAARRVGRLAGQQADRRQDDPERRLPGRSRARVGLRRPGEGARGPSTTR